jgi:hypothetical protein
MADPFVFDDAPVPSDPGFGEHAAKAVVFTKPPYVWLFAGLGGAVLGCAIAWIWSSIPVAVLGWFLAGPVGLTLLAWFVNRDNRARSRGVYLAPSWLAGAYIGAFVASLLCVLATALRLAWGFGRLF